jgi:hypothetical protein
MRPYKTTKRHGTQNTRPGNQASAAIKNEPPPPPTHTQSFQRARATKMAHTPHAGESQKASGGAGKGAAAATAARPAASGRSPATALLYASSLMAS